MPRKRIDWKLRDGTFHLGERTLLTGVLNVTPDSVADAGHYVDPGRAYLRAVELAGQGADIVELGAESIRPGSSRVTEAEELRRLVPVLKRLRGKFDVPLCVETSKAAVAAKAFEYGARILKDPSGLTLDPDIPKVVARHNAGLVLQHMRGTPEQWVRMAPMKDALFVVASELGAAVHRAIRAGVERQRIAIDPGLGLGKRKEQNTEIIAGLDRLAALELPLQVSPTGKPFATQPQVEEGLPVWLAAATAAVLRGAHLLRVHDVAAVRAAVFFADELLRA